MSFEWETATCPFCNEEYQYPKDDYKPTTCGKFNCLQRYFYPHIEDTSNPAIALLMGRDALHRMIDEREVQ